MADSRYLRNMLSWLIAGTQGGSTRFKIIQALHEVPSNANQLATILNKDYTTIRHHLKILLANRLISSIGEGYATTYVLSSILEENYHIIEEIQERVTKRGKRA